MHVKRLFDLINMMTDHIFIITFRECHQSKNLGSIMDDRSFMYLITYVKRLSDLINSMTDQII